MKLLEKIRGAVKQAAFAKAALGGFLAFARAEAASAHPRVRYWDARFHCWRYR